MSSRSSILVIAGSERAGSLNQRLARHAAQRLEADGHAADVFSLRDLALPSGLEATADKPVALMSASPGAAGGLRSLNHLRQFMQTQFATIVVPQQFALGRANEAFDDDGALKDERSAVAVGGVLASLLRLTEALKATSGR